MEKLMGKHVKPVLLVSLCLFAFIGCAGLRSGYMLTLAHVNDTHGHLDSLPLQFALDNITIRTEAGGFPRLAACVKKLRDDHDNLLFVHAGDVFQGTLYFNRFGGRADCNLFNLMGLDAMTPGNHEFDRGPQALAVFADQADFDLVSANIDVSKEPSLREIIKPYIIREIKGGKVGIIGLTTPDTPALSRPGPTMVFQDPEQAARKAIEALVAQGVHAIIVLSHLGYSRDVELAVRLPEIDVIAGGHTHTLLGDFRALGFAGEGPYPTVCKNADNATVLVVQAWEWARVVGALTVSFDRQGHVTSWAGEPLMPVSGVFTQESSNGRRSAVSPEMKKKVQEKLARSPGIVCINEDAEARRMLEPYAQVVSVVYRQKAAQAPEELVHVRLPQAGTALSGGSQVAPLVADAMLWKVRALGTGADAALVNAGAVRGSISKGDVSVGQLADVLPFGNRLVVCRVSGRNIRKLLNAGIDRAFSSAENDGAFPYVAGLRYTADRAKPAGKRLVRVELKDSMGRWRTLADAASCRIVTNNYLAGGADGYGLFPEIARQAEDTGYGDAEVFIEYAGMKGELKLPSEQRIKLKGI